MVSDVEFWDEIGSLVFELVGKDQVNFNLIIIDEKWKKNCKMEKLIFEDSIVASESGLSINIDNSEIIIISSSFPYSIEILADFLSQDFEPECDIKKYKRISLVD